ncbi:GspH/FimT family pseudopilin [Halomonas sp. 11-S5]|uniref:GspH/FimT family pseudopilin n=1 Tax=Halomonas sp. 11-S5 TaxID=2994064 RepID=UPI0024693A66|nr:GspH/FimT family pseudopilin [Halomonas sp. 11-S5]
MRPAVNFPLSSSRQHGFTLIELIVAIAVLAIMVTWAIPSFQRFTARNEVAAEVMRIKTALALARNTAVTRRTTISVCSSPGPDYDTCTFDDWSHPWVVVEGEASGGDLTDDIVLRLLDGPTKDVSFNRDDRPVRFSPLGRASGYNGTFSICNAHGETAAVIISNMGRVRTEADSTSC